MVSCRAARLAGGLWPSGPRWWRKAGRDPELQFSGAHV